MRTLNFSKFAVSKFEILRESQWGTFSHLTYLEMSTRDRKNYRKNIIKYLDEDREVSEEVMMSFQNGTKVRKNVCCIWIWDIQMRLLSSL